MIKNRAVFLDRDGTINKDKGFVYRIKDFEFIDGAIEAIRLLNESNFKVIVVANQSGIGRGYYTEKDLQILHRFINKELTKNNAWIDKFYYCPHHPEAKIEKYRANCECRKPKAGMLKKAVNDFNINIKRSYLIGDRLIDIEAGKSLGCKTILIVTNSNLREEKLKKEEQTWKVDSLKSAVTQILEFETELTKKEKRGFK